MGNLDTTLNADGAAFLADFGETIIFVPKGASGIPLIAVVERETPESISGTGNGGAVKATSIHIRNDAVLGRTAVNLNGDAVIVAHRQGGTPEARTVNGIISQDAGMWHLSLR